MKTITLNEFEQKFLNNVVDTQIDLTSKRLKYYEDISYDYAENALRKELESLLELQKKIS